MLSLSYEAKGTLFDVTFTEGVTIIKDDSGTGKSFLFDTLIGELRERGIIFKFLDYRSRENARDILLDLDSECSVVILDNADLYLTKDIFRHLKDTVKYALIVTKDTGDLPIEDVTFSAVDYEAGSLMLVTIL